VNNFAERLYELRNKSNMSQGDLADRLDVSRQTVSKWENGICMPETEKLVELSEIFTVSTDYILKGEEKSTQPVYIYVKDAESQSASGNNELIVRKYVGMTLAVAFSIFAIVFFIIGGGIFALIPVMVVLLGILLTKNAKHPWLITGWSSYVIVIAYLLYATGGLSPLAILVPELYKNLQPQLFIVLGEWIVLALLVAFTVKAKRGFVFRKKQGNFK